MNAFYGCRDLIIYVSSNSYAETYAKKNNVPFIPIVENGEVTPAMPKKNTVLNDSSSKCGVKVSSTSTKNPTVTYTKSTNTKAANITIPATVTIDNVTYKVTSVATSAFSGNNKFTKVTIGKNITSIGKNAFKNCTKLKSIVMKSAI